VGRLCPYRRDFYCERESCDFLECRTGNVEVCCFDRNPSGRLKTKVPRNLLLLRMDDLCLGRCDISSIRGGF
jgi:hypothetical protein